MRSDFMQAGNHIKRQKMFLSAAEDLLAAGTG